MGCGVFWCARGGLAPVLLFLLFAASVRADTIGGAGGLTVTVDPSGTYNVGVPSPAWSFGGSIGYPLTNLTTTSGADRIGSFSEISFDFLSDAPRHAAIRSYWYQRVVLFSARCPSDAPNTLSFPNFSRYPKDFGHINFAGMFAFPTFYGFANESPWVFFDSAANAFVISPASNFMVAQTAWGPNGEIASGISPQIPSLPAGFTQQAVLVIESGINRAFDTWGQALTGLGGKTRPASDRDVTLNQLGYWTDAGSTYYYHTEPQHSYTETLAAVKADFDRQGITLGYMQLDSWFYPKGPAADWSDGSHGFYEYLAAPQLFSSGLAGFQQVLSTGLVTHARWIDASSPYRSQYQVSGNVSTDPRYWSDIAGYLAGSGVATYEQDWLSHEAQTEFNLTDPDAFLDNMASALAQRNITIQYCMATPRHFLQSSKYGNVTSIRTSEDRCGRARWTNFLYASRLASALGLWPFTDVLMSTETENLLLATLSAGPIGVGDPLGAESAANLLHAVRKDGVIVKPDVPLAPLDSNYLGDAHSAGAPMIASTYTDFDGLRTHYVLAYNRGTDTEAGFRTADLGLGQPAYVYNYFEGTGALVDPGDVTRWVFGNGLWYLVVAPVGNSGIAVLGDEGQFVSLGKKRVTAFTDDGVVNLTMAFAKGEGARTLHGYSPDPPAAAAITGTAGPLDYDSATRRFRVAVTPGPDGTASIQISRAVVAQQPATAPEPSDRRFSGSSQPPDEP